MVRQSIAESASGYRDFGVGHAEAVDRAETRVCATRQPLKMRTETSACARQNVWMSSVRATTQSWDDIAGADENTDQLGAGDKMPSR